MRKFTFHLEPVLRVRELAEQQCQRDVASSHAEARNLEEALRALHAQVSTAMTNLHAGLRGGTVDPAFLANHGRHVAALEQSATEMQRSLDHARQRLYVAEQALASAVSAHKSLEKLRERAREQWLATLRSDERRELEELAARIPHENRG